jgi:hypothetical protein
MRKSIASTILLMVIAVSIAAQNLPLPLLGKIQSDSPIESAVVVRNEGGALFCVYAAGQTLHVERRLKTDSDFSPYPLDLSQVDIVSIRDVKAFDRFGNIWMVFFVATDHTGNESVRALEFDEKGELGYSAYGIFDDSTAGLAVKEYQVQADGIFSFYLAERKEHGIGILYADHDRTSRTLTRSRQSLNSSDTDPAIMICFMSQNCFWVAADYSQAVSQTKHSVILALRNGVAEARQDLGLYTDTLENAISYSISATEELALFRRDTLISVRRFSSGLPAGSWEFTALNGVYSNAGFAFPSFNHLIVTTREPGYISVSDISLSDMSSSLIARFANCDSLRGFFRKGETSSPELLLMVSGSQGEFLVERLCFNSSTQEYEDSGRIALPGQVAGSTSGIRVALARDEPSALLVDVTSESVTWLTFSDFASTHALGGKFSSATLPLVLTQGEIRIAARAPNLIAESGVYSIVIKPNGEAAWAPRGQARSGCDEVIVAFESSSLFSVYSTKE